MQIQIDINEVLNRYKSIVSDLEYQLIIKDMQIEELMKMVDSTPTEVDSSEE